MPFMVIYRTSDGSSSFEQADAIDEAALFVERLRNKEGIDEIRIYRMEEISFAFRPYYKVELGLAERQNTPPPPPSASTAAVVERGPERRTTDAPAPRSSRRRPRPTSPSTSRAGRRHRRAHRVDPARRRRPAADGEPAGANGRRGLFGR